MPLRDLDTISQCLDEIQMQGLSGGNLAVGQVIIKSTGHPNVGWQAAGGDREARGQRSRERVRAIEPRVEDSESDEGGGGSEEESGGCDMEYEIDYIKGARYRKGQQFLVAWKGYNDETWENEVDLLEDGASESIEDYLSTHTRKGVVRKGLSGT